MAAAGLPLSRGAAARFFEGAPSALTHASISNAYLDPDGIKIIRTNHDLTGPSAKISYATPRILGLRASRDFGVVLKTGPRPDDDGNRIMGVYAHWAKEGFSFWVDMDEPTIELYCSKGDR